MLPADALAQHERVLRTDRNDQGEAEAKAGQGYGKVDRGYQHRHTLRRANCAIQLIF